MMSATATAATSAATSAGDLYAQALKALSERCPFENEEFASRVPTLPFGVAAHLSRRSDGRRKFKKSASGHGEQSLEAAAPPQVAKQSKGTNLWDLMEVYFRPITVADIESLKPRGLLDSCLKIPVLEGSLLEEQKDVIFSGNEVGVSSEALKEEDDVEEYYEDDDDDDDALGDLFESGIGDDWEDFGDGDGRDDKEGNENVEFWSLKSGGESSGSAGVEERAEAW